VFADGNVQADYSNFNALNEISSFEVFLQIVVPPNAREKMKDDNRSNEYGPRDF